MKFSKCVILVLILCGSFTENATKKSRNGVGDIWEEFKKVHNKDYKTCEEDLFRRVVWEDNIEIIKTHNLEYDLGLHTYSLGINEYADLNSKEYQQKLLGARSPNFKESKLKVQKYISETEDAPKSLDWRPRGYVTPIKNQKGCGSCWAFSSTGALEGQHFKATGKLVSLSEQNLVDCSKGFGNNGCNGGWQRKAYEYIGENGGIDREDCYSYKAREGRCRFDQSCIGAILEAYALVSSGREDDLQDAAANIGPISVAIDANHNSFHLYKSGVYYEPRCSNITTDHAVLVVGYGESSDGKYWLVKNSWGTSWGEAGYIKMAKDRSNNCAIASFATYPIVDFD